MDKIKIELTEEEARQFKLFCLIKTLAGVEDFEYLQHQRIKGGRLIIHLKVKENLQ